MEKRGVNGPIFILKIRLGPSVRMAFQEGILINVFARDLCGTRSPVCPHALVKGLFNLSCRRGPSIPFTRDWDLKVAPFGAV
jgi:hypothetical protein